MEQETTTVRDVVETELEQLERHGEAAIEFFQELASDIKRDFSSVLDGILTQDLPAFQQQVNRSLASSSFTAPVADMLGDTLSGLLPTGGFGDVLGAAVGGALRTVLGDVSRGGGVDIGRIVRGASRSGNTQLDRVNRSGGLSLSDSQQHLGAWEALSKAQRNL